MSFAQFEPHCVFISLCMLSKIPDAIAHIMGSYVYVASVYPLLQYKCEGVSMVKL